MRIAIRVALVAYATALHVGVLGQNALIIQGARIVTGTGAVIERGSILVQGDKIASVGADVTVPPGATIIDGTGLTVYPGLIDAFCLAGVAAPPVAPAQTAPATPPGGQRRGGRGAPQFTAPPASPMVWRKATEGLDVKAAAFASLRNNGYTSALLGVRGPLTPGENALVALTPGDDGPSVLVDRAAINVNTMSRGFNAYPSTLMGACAFLRQSMHDAIDYRNHPPEKPDPKLAALAEAVDAKVPVFFTATRTNDIMRGLRLGAEFNLRLVLLGGKDCEQALPQLKQTRASVVLSDDWGPAIILAKAGIPFALVSNDIDMSAGGADTLRSKAIGLAEKGMAPEALLAALTRTPAEILGVADRLGTIAQGKLANLVITQGDLFHKDTKVKFVLVLGGRIDPVTVVADAGKRRGRVPEDGVEYITTNYDTADDDGGAR